MQDKIPQNIKYRDIYNKEFLQCKGAKKTLYGLDTLKKYDEPNQRTNWYPSFVPNHLVIVEGEMDKLSLDEAGVLFGLSVPDGAPAQVSDPGNLSKGLTTGEGNQ